MALRFFETWKTVSQSTQQQPPQKNAEYSAAPPSEPEMPYYIILKGKGKGKAVPLQSWSGPEGSRKLRFPDYMKKAQDGDKAVSLMHLPPLPPGNAPSTHFC
jgi:hypothetical protein